MDLPFLLYIVLTVLHNHIYVSILVLMDLPFLLEANKNKLHLENFVSILVLMDLPFLPDITGVNITESEDCFNPCSYGSSVLTKDEIYPYKITFDGFNPCSYGSSVLT